jgi:hypothetical protein
MPSRDKGSFWTRNRSSKKTGGSGPARVASGRYIDLNDRNVVNTLSATKMAWQQLAWNYRDLIGELGAALRLKANIISKVQFIAAAVVDGEDEPRRLTGDPEKDVIKGEDEAPDEPILAQHVIDAAIDCLSRLPFQNGYSFQGMISQSFDVPGECWLHGYSDDDGDEAWEVLSTSEVIAGTGGLSIMEVPGKAARPIDIKTESLIRLHVPHPQWKQLADSPMRMLLDQCEDVVLVGREIRAAARSRIAANGFLLVPNELSMSKRDDPEITPENDTFQADLTAAITAPIANEGDAGAVVPIVIRGETEDLEQFRHVTIDREASPELLAKQAAGLGRIASGINLPSEMMDTGSGGLGSVNHWTGWLVDATTFKNYIEPDCRLIADSITMSYFRRTLRLPITEGGYGLTKDEALSVTIWYDGGNVTENANRSKDADDAMTQGAISFEAYRAAKGFGEEDAPSEEDLQQIQMVKSAPSPDIAGQLAAILLGVREPKPAPVQPPQVIQGQAVREPAQIGPGAKQGQVPDAPVPTTQPAPVRASAAKEPTIITGEVLAEIDKELRERLRQAGDDALLRAIEKAGNRIKAKAQSNTEVAALVNGLPATEAGAAVGPERVAELGLTEDLLLAAAFAALSASFAVWTAAAIKTAIKTVAGMVPVPLTKSSAMAQAMNARIPSAWKRFEGSLRKRALDKMYGRAGDEMRGEVPDTIVLPGDIREALAEIGGGGSGLALGGDILRTIDDVAEPIGFTWRYGITPRARAFEPHLKLAGKRFNGFEDEALTPPAGYEWVGARMEPGDHNGCMCDYVMAWMLDEADEVARGDVLQESGAMSAERMLADLDDAAGRSGTTAQRTRDQRDRIVAVQENWINRKALK